MTYHNEAEQIRESRALLLDFLNAPYPAGLREDKLLEVMLSLADPQPENDTRRDLGYLEARGLIAKRREKHPVTGKPMILWALSAAGVTFVERDKPWGELEGC